MKKTSWAAIAMLAVAITWGAAFVLMKDAIQDQPFYDFLATRFTLAVLVMIAFRPRVLRAIDGPTLKHGVVLGTLLAGGYITQTIGLELTTAAITGFITGLYVVLTPLIGWLMFGNKINKQLVVGIALAFIALGFLTLNGFAIDVNQLWVVLCAILFAGHIVGLSVWSPGKDVYALTLVQLALVAIYSWAGALMDGSYDAPVNGDGWFAIVFTAVFSTAVAFLVQTWAQSIMDPSRVAIFLTTEVLWTAVIAVLVGQEVLGLKTVLGGALMVAAMLVVEWPTKSSKDLPVQPRLLD
jgi:drug/metabolite transporter (DMT)-like permease